MKFAEHLSAHITPEWRKQYIQYETDPIDYVESVCENMQLFPKEDFLTGDQLMFEYKPEIISAALNLLTPQKANLLLLSPDNEGRCELKEKWFGTQYSVEEIDKEWSKRWSADFQLNSDLHLPTENMFIDGAQQTRLYWTTMLQTGLMPSQPPHPLNNEEAGKP